MREPGVSREIGIAFACEQLSAVADEEQLEQHREKREAITRVGDPVRQLLGLARGNDLQRGAYRDGHLKPVPARHGVQTRV